jgi:hypothetical protein
MAIQNHIHLHALTAGGEVGMYHVKQGSYDDTPQIPLVIDRALDATLHYSRVMDSVGNPVILTNKSFTLSFLSRAEVDALIALASRPCYFIGIDHSATGNTSGHVSERKQVVMMIKPSSLTNVDTGVQYWMMGVELIDND